VWLLVVGLGRPRPVTWGASAGLVRVVWGVGVAVGLPVVTRATTAPAATATARPASSPLMPAAPRR
jgi:hypothetical protein